MSGGLLLDTNVGDPFDRLLVAQAIAERLTLVSGDSVLRSYPVAVLG